MIVYTKQNCPKCNEVKSYLKQNNREFLQVEIGKDVSREEFLDAFPNIRSVPFMIGNNGEHINNLSELETYYATSEQSRSGSSA